MKPYQFAKSVFNQYAAMDASELPEDSVSALQVMLCRWQNRNFDEGDARTIILGLIEELGELAHAVKKRKEGIRGMHDRELFLEKSGDAIADCAIYLIQLSTMLRMDFGTLLAATAGDVLERDWKAYPETGYPPKDGAPEDIRCADCGKTLSVSERFWSDIPGTGDLCNLCHEAMVGSLRRSEATDEG